MSNFLIIPARLTTVNREIELKCNMFTIPIYNLNVFVSQSKRLCVHAVVFEHVNGNIYTCFNDISTATLIHETSHVLDELCSHIGENLHGESRAYLSSYIYEKLKSNLKRR